MNTTKRNKYHHFQSQTAEFFTIYYYFGICSSACSSLLISYYFSFYSSFYSSSLLLLELDISYDRCFIVFSDYSTYQLIFCKSSAFLQFAQSFILELMLQNPSAHPNFDIMYSACGMQFIAHNAVVKASTHES